MEEFDATNYIITYNIKKKYGYENTSDGKVRLFTYNEVMDNHSFTIMEANHETVGIFGSRNEADVYAKLVSWC